MLIDTGKRTRAAQRSPNGDPCTQQNGGDGFTRPKPDCHPYQNRESKEGKRIVRTRHRLAALKNNPCYEAEQRDREAYVQQSGATPMEGRLRCPENDCGGDDESANGITEPPGHPNRTILFPVGVPSQGETGDSESCAHGGTEQSSQKHKPKRIALLPEDFATVRKMVDQKCAHEPFHGVPSCDSERGCNRTSCCEIDRKRSEKNRRPHPISKQKKARQTDSRWRPYRSCAGMKNSQLKTKLCGENIAHGKTAQQDPSLDGAQSPLEGVRQTKSRLSEMPHARQGIHRTRSAYGLFSGEHRCFYHTLNFRNAL